MATLRSALVLAVLSTLACGGGTQSAPLPTTPTTTAAESTGCPLGIEGARVTATDTSDGVALVFTTGTRVNELRTRARTAAEMHGAGQQQGVGHDGVHGQGGHHGLHAMHLPPARATVTDVTDGVRLDLVPLEASNLALLREKAADGARRVQVRCD
jgi:hypothetical protein